MKRYDYMIPRTTTIIMITRTIIRNSSSSGIAKTTNPRTRKKIGSASAGYRWI
jgi:hypothetical protein